MNIEKHCVIAALKDIVCSVEHDEDAIARYFAPGYHQEVDGKELDYAGFIQHMALLKKLTQRIELSLLAIAAEGNTVFTHHQVTVEKKDGARTMIEVLARFTLLNGQIVQCQELTHLISGDHGDRDLGSRRE